MFYTDTTDDIFPTDSQFDTYNIQFGNLDRYLNTQLSNFHYHNELSGQIQYINFSDKPISYPFVQHWNYKYNRLSKADKYDNYYAQKFNLENSKFANLDINPLYLNTINDIIDNNLLKLDTQSDYIQKIDEQQPTLYDSSTGEFKAFDILPANPVQEYIKYNLHDITNDYSMLSYDYKNIFVTNASNMPFNINYISNKSINGQKDEAFVLYELNTITLDDYGNTEHVSYYFIPIQERGSYYVDEIDSTLTLIETDYTCKDFTTIFDETETPILTDDIDYDATYYDSDITNIPTQYNMQLYDENNTHHEMTQFTAYKLTHAIIIDDSQLIVYVPHDNTSMLDLDPFDQSMVIDSTNIQINDMNTKEIYMLIKNIILKHQPNFYTDCKYVSGITENAHIVNIPQHLPDQLKMQDGLMLSNQTYKILYNPDATVKLPPLDFVITKRIQKTKVNYNKTPYIVSTNIFNKHIKAHIDDKWNVKNISNAKGYNIENNKEIIIKNNILYYDNNNIIFDTNSYEYLIFKPSYDDSTLLSHLYNRESNLISQNDIIYTSQYNNINFNMETYYLCSPNEKHDLFLLFDVPYTFFNKIISDSNKTSNDSLMLTVYEQNDTTSNETITQLSPTDVFYLTKTPFETIQNLTLYDTICEASNYGKKYETFYYDLTFYRETGNLDNDTNLYVNCLYYPNQNRDLSGSSNNTEIYYPIELRINESTTYLIYIGYQVEYLNNSTSFTSKLNY